MSCARRARIRVQPPLGKAGRAKLIDAGFGRTVLMVTAEPPLSACSAGGTRQCLHADLFLSIHHDAVPDSLIETWQYEGRSTISATGSGATPSHLARQPRRPGQPAVRQAAGRNTSRRARLQYTPTTPSRSMGTRRPQPGGTPMPAFIDTTAGGAARHPDARRPPRSGLDRQPGRGIAAGHAGAPVAYRRGAAEAVKLYCAAPRPAIRQANPVKPPPARLSSPDGRSVIR